MKYRSLFTGALALSLGAFSAHADTVDQTNPDGLPLAALAEQCTAMVSNPGEAPERYYPSPIASVIDATEKAEKYTLSLPQGGKVAEIICVRLDIIPAPNDYKVIAAGYPLVIMDKGEGHVPRQATLWYEKVIFGFHIDRGDDLTPDQKAEVGARIAAFRAAMNKN